MVRMRSALVGKGYAAAGQADACLHTMAVLQAYHANLLKELDEGKEIKGLSTLNAMRKIKANHLQRFLSHRARNECSPSANSRLHARRCRQTLIFLTCTSFYVLDKWTVRYLLVMSFAFIFHV